ncbi:cytochrome P450 [Micromonospora profundi]|uniref:cytochrome P450 n=1 Tax=Micromonospora profundi TaxID=1420889 RepID=UPI0038203C07
MTTDVETGESDDILDQVVTVDLADPRLYAGERPERLWATMRRAGTPLRMTGLREHWAVTRYEQVREVFRASHLLSSQKGNRLGEKPSDIAAGEAAGGLSMLVADDPAHARMRRALESAFSPRALGRLTDSTHALARRLVSDAVAQPSVDFVDAIVTPLLTTVACDLLGIPQSDRPRLAELSQMAFSGAGHVTATAQMTAHVELLAYCDELLTSKYRSPGDDLATTLAQAQRDGDAMSRSAAIMNCHDFILGGNASARYVLTAIPLTMVRHRQFWASLRAGDADFGVAAEELLRYEAPVNHVMRSLLDDLEIGGVTMRRGELVTLWLRSANRDADVFDDPEHMSLSPRSRPHLSFGHGPHYCIAAYLGRLEIASLLRALADLVDDAELAGEPRRMESSFLRGYRSVPLALHGKG